MEILGSVHNSFKALIQCTALMMMLLTGFGK